MAVVLVQSSRSYFLEVNSQKEIKGQLVKVTKTSKYGASMNCFVPKYIRAGATGEATQALSSQTLYSHAWVALASFPLPRTEDTHE